MTQNQGATVTEGGIAKGYEYTVEPLLYLFVDSKLKPVLFFIKRNLERKDPRNLITV